MEHESSKRLVLEGVSSTATPHTKRQCYAHHNVTPPNACDAGSFLSNLNEATTTGGPETPTKEPEIGDEMQQRAIALANQGHNLFLTGRAGTVKAQENSFRISVVNMHQTTSSFVVHALQVNHGPQSV